MVNKFFGALFLLVAMVWRDVRSPNNKNDGGGDSNRTMGYQRPADHRRPQPNYLQGPSYPYRREQVQRPYFAGGGGGGRPN